MNVSAQKAVILVCGLVLAGCGGANGSPAPQPTSAQVVTLSASPATYTFPLDDNTPEPISVARSSGTFTSLALGVSDPTVVGVTAPVFNGASALFSVIPIAHGATTVTATDSTGATTSASVATASCGRPSSLVAAQEVAPAAGATGVSPSVGTLYFVAYFLNGLGATGNLHLIVGAHGTLEGGPLVVATLPPGTVLPSPIPLPNAAGISVRATVPALVPGQQYKTQLYNDTCQPAVMAGTFST